MAAPVKSLDRYFAFDVEQKEILGIAKRDRSREWVVKVQDRISLDEKRLALLSLALLKYSQRFMWAPSERPYVKAEVLEVHS